MQFVAITEFGLTTPFHAWHNNCDSFPEQPSFPSAFYPFNGKSRKSETHIGSNSVMTNVL
jgi:hypothetical protein